MDAVQKEIRLVDLLVVLAKHRLFIAKVCGMALILSVMYALYLPNIYSATARVLPPQKDGGGNLAALMGQMGGLLSLMQGGVTGSSELYVGILKSRSVEDAIVKNLDLAAVYKTRTPEDTRLRLERAVKFQLGTKDGIITITASDKDPQRAARVANAFVEELGKANVRLNSTKSGTERSFLEKRLTLVKDDLRRAEEDLRAFSRQHKVVQVDAQAKASIETVARLKAALASKEVQLAALRSYQTDENSEVKMIQTSIKNIRSQLASRAGSGGDDEGIPTIGTVSDLGVEYLRKMREFKTQEAIFEQLTKQYELAKLGEAKDFPTIQVLDEAVVPTKKSKPKRSLIVAAGVTIAFFASLLTIVSKEFFGTLPEEQLGVWRDLFSFRHRHSERE